MSDLWLVSVFKQRCINYAFASRLRHLKQVYTLVITKRCIHVQANQWASFTIRAYERGTKARLSFSGGPHAPVNMADIMKEVYVGGKNAGKWQVCHAILRFISYAKCSQILEVLWNRHTDTQTDDSKLSPKTFLPAATDTLSDSSPATTLVSVGGKIAMNLVHWFWIVLRNPTPSLPKGEKEPID